MAHTSKTERHYGRTLLLTSVAFAASTLVPAVAAAQAAPAPITGTRLPPAHVPDEQEIVVIGAIKDGKAAKPVDNPADARLPALPVVYDDEAPAAKPSA